MATGPAIIRQDNFGAGMFMSRTPELIPANGVFDASNCLVDDTGGLYKRGGSTYFTGTGWPGSSQVIWVWDGTLTGGQRTLFATYTNLYRYNAGTVTNLGTYAGMAAGANRPAVIGGVMYLPPNKTYDGTTFGTLGVSAAYWTSVANRLVGATGAQVAFSGVGTTTFAGTDFWLIPGGAAITGLAALRDSVVVFTDQGTWVISNIALNLTDAAGNIQQRLDLYSPDLIQWGTGAAGVVGYQGGLIVPARDGVWLMRLGATSEVAEPLRLLSRPITELYRSYVENLQGYFPGIAAVWRGHYFLPIVDAFGIVHDLLVCRLDAPGQPWTRFSSVVMPTSLTPAQNGQTLIGGIAQRLLTLDCFGPTITDADGLAVTWFIRPRDYATGRLNSNSVVKLRMGYRATHGSAAPMISADVLDVATGASTTLTGTATGSTSSTPSGTTANLVPLKSFSWPVRKRTPFARFQLYSTSASTYCALRSLEVFIRSSGRL
jgi:hypothetical protein